MVISIRNNLLYATAENWWIMWSIHSKHRRKHGMSWSPKWIAEGARFSFGDIACFYHMARDRRRYCAAVEEIAKQKKLGFSEILERLQ